ncbi:hypothetical protein BBJ28_00025749 [Nothophytophthora sp. Chile5]|nr:hypothetical protein BBJ28_00025749 [Nothophytophthora sp. Chile5]
MHSQGLTHGNLKCTHILVSTDETAKICDLGLTYGPEQGAFNRWKSPEANNGSGADPSKPGDVYAFGLCIIEARTGAIPYDMDSDDLVENRLRQGEAYPRPDGMRDDEWDVVKKLCALKPEDRPTMEQAIEMLAELAAREEQEERADAKGKLKE